MPAPSFRLDIGPETTLEAIVWWASFVAAHHIFVCATIDARPNNTMGWFSRKKEIAELRKQVARLTQLVSQQHQPAGFDPSTLLVGLLDGQVKQVESMGGFIRTISDIAAERMASSLGRRGGRKRAATAQRDARGRMLPGRSAGRPAGDCILCDDPGAANFTTAEFEEHQKHKNRSRRIERENRDEPIDVSPEPSIAAEPHTHYPLPTVQHPLVAVPEGDQDSGAGRGAEVAHDDDAGHRNGVA